MKKLANSILIRFVTFIFSGVLISAPAAYAQYHVPAAPSASVFAQPELDQMLAPIALYPDSLLSQILMAATYPLEVAAAARWSQSNPHLQGDQAVIATEQADWDPSVRSLVAFPEILAMMDENPEWTRRLGDAFISQQAHVLDTVQQLRARAYAAGNLRSTGELRVERQGQALIVEPVHPQAIYVPYYDPVIVYGPWWWPAYPPVHWRAWPRHHAHPRSVSGVTWSGAIPVSAGFFFGGFDWHRRHARIVNVNNYYYNRSVRRDAGGWTHDPAHRRGAAYPDATFRQGSNRATTAPEARRSFDGRSNGSAQDPNRGASRDAPPERANARTETRQNVLERTPGSPQPETRGGGRPDTRIAPGNRPDGRLPNRSDAGERPASLARGVEVQPLGATGSRVPAVEARSLQGSERSRVVSRPFVHGVAIERTVQPPRIGSARDGQQRDAQIGARMHTRQDTAPIHGRAIAPQPAAQQVVTRRSGVPDQQSNPRPSRNSAGASDNRRQRD